MANRTIVLLGIAFLLVAGFALGVRSCAGGDGVPTETSTAGQPAIEGVGTGPGDALADEATRQALLQLRSDAMVDAASTLHRYFAALPGDRATADTFWAGGKPPANSGEADLRTLEDLRALRIQNRTPSALDSAPVPDSLQVPVELRAIVGQTAMRHYRGWYRMRRSVSDNGWEITSASIDVLPDAE
jgi:hypothetical protein